MHSVKKKFEKRQWLRHGAIIGVGLALLLLSCVQLTFAQNLVRPTFASAVEASKALFAAVQRNDEQAIMRILGAGKELVSSDDELADRRERERFTKKYQEMHRLVREPDGTTVLYIGAENWPFPVPLVSKKGRWYFDSDAGAQEIFFRQLGEDEDTAIKTCHEVVLASKEHERKETDDDPIAQYARTLLSAQAAKSGAASANQDAASAPFYGYYFRILSAQGKAGNVPESTNGGLAVTAYPAEYRSSGVMTFIVTENDVVYEKDLGPNTAQTAKAMTVWKPDSTWLIAE
jgi:Protein of unknown function (DUF2950)